MVIPIYTDKSILWPPTAHPHLNGILLVCGGYVDDMINRWLEINENMDSSCQFWVVSKLTLRQLLVPLVPRLKWHQNAQRVNSTSVDVRRRSDKIMGSGASSGTSSKKQQHQPHFAAPWRKWWAEGYPVGATYRYVSQYGSYIGDN